MLKYTEEGKERVERLLKTLDGVLNEFSQLSFNDLMDMGTNEKISMESRIGSIFTILDNTARFRAIAGMMFQDWNSEKNASIATDDKVVDRMIADKRFEYSKSPFMQEYWGFVKEQFSQQLIDMMTGKIPMDHDLIPEDPFQKGSTKDKSDPAPKLAKKDKEPRQPKFEPIKGKIALDDMLANMGVVLPTSRKKK